MTETPDPTQTPALTDRLALEADVADEAGTTWLADLLREAAVTTQQGTAARRAFLERAVCHPGPPLSETEDYTGEEDLGELEAMVLERLDREIRLESDLGTIWRLTEEAMGGTLGIGRNTSIDPLDAVRRLLNEIAGMVDDAIARRYTKAAGEYALPLVERVRREIGRGLRALPSFAQRDINNPGPVAVDNGQHDAVAEHIRAAGGDPERATVAQIGDALNATSEGLTFTPNAAGDGVLWEIDQKAMVSTIEVVGGDRVAELGLAPPGVKLQWDSPDTFEVAPPKRITPRVDRMGTSYEEASEWAGGPVVLHDGKVDMPRLVAAQKHLESVTKPPLMPLEVVMQIGFATFKPEATSVVWAGKVISTGDADLSLQMENPVRELSVFNFEDSMGRSRKQSGKGRLWLALDDATAERLGFYRGAGLDGPVSLTLLWPSSETMRFEVRLGDTPDNLTPPAQSPGERRQWYGYQIEVCPYPGPAADLFQTRNRP